MTITENNCEEYFLLYVDDELTNAERNAVEAFVQQHLQYKTILDGLLQTKLTVDGNDVFTNKNILLKNEEKEIGIDNYEEYFLLYTDNELNEEDKENTERFVLQHPQLQTEFTLLQQTRLPVENVECINKEKLYKKERRVVPLYITRLAIAATVAGVIAFSWLLTVPDKHQNTMAVVKPAEQKKQDVKTIQIDVQPKKTTTDLQPVIAKKTEQKQIIKPLIPSVKTNDKNQVAADVALNHQTDELPALKETKAPETAQTEPQQKQVAVATKTAETLKPLEEVNAEETNTQTALLVSSDDNIAKPAVYKELQTDDDDHTLYVGSLQLNKAKVNGILKSASRLLGGRSRQNAE